MVPPRSYLVDGSWSGGRGPSPSGASSVHSRHRVATRSRAKRSIHRRGRRAFHAHRDAARGAAGAPIHIYVFIRRLRLPDAEASHVVGLWSRLPWSGGAPDRSPNPASATYTSRTLHSHSRFAPGARPILGLSGTSSPHDRRSPPPPPRYRNRDWSHEDPGTGVEGQSRTRPETPFPPLFPTLKSWGTVPVPPRPRHLSSSVTPRHRPLCPRSLCLSESVHTRLELLRPVSGRRVSPGLWARTFVG